MSKKNFGLVSLGTIILKGIIQIRVDLIFLIQKIFNDLEKPKDCIELGANIG